MNAQLKHDLDAAHLAAVDFLNALARALCTLGIIAAVAIETVLTAGRDRCYRRELGAGRPSERGQNANTARSRFLEVL